MIENFNHVTTAGQDNQVFCSLAADAYRSDTSFDFGNFDTITCSYPLPELTFDNGLDGYTFSPSFDTGFNDYSPASDSGDTGFQSGASTVDQGADQPFDLTPYECREPGPREIAEVPYEFRNDTALQNAVSNVGGECYRDATIQQLAGSDPALANALTVAQGLVDNGAMSQAGFDRFEQNVAQNVGMDSQGNMTAQSQFNNAYSVLSASGDGLNDRDMMSAFRAQESALSSNGDHKLWDEPVSTYQQREDAGAAVQGDAPVQAGDYQVTDFFDQMWP